MVDANQHFVAHVASTVVRLLLAALLLGGCVSRALEPGEVPTAQVDLGRDGGGVVTVVDLAMAADLAVPCSAAEADFVTDIWPRVLMECGQCHSTASGGIGPGFLGSPEAFLAYLGSDASFEKILPPNHPGGLVSADLMAAIKTWLVEYQLACRP
jgi:hypothetical protein